VRSIIFENSPSSLKSLCSPKDLVACQYVLMKKGQMISSINVAYRQDESTRTEGLHLAIDLFHLRPC